MKLYDEHCAICGIPHTAICNRKFYICPSCLEKVKDAYNLVQIDSSGGPGESTDDRFRMIEERVSALENWRMNFIQTALPVTPLAGYCDGCCGCKE